MPSATHHPYTCTFVLNEAMTPILEVQDAVDNITAWNAIFADEDTLPEYIAIWSAVEHLPVNEIQEALNDNRAHQEQVLRTLKQAIKTELIDQAIDGTLEPDFNALDMDAILENGLEKIAQRGEVTV